LATLSSLLRSAIIACIVPVPSAAAAACPAPDKSASGEVYDEFDRTSVDPCRWSIVQEHWGGKRDGEDYNGGVVAANVEVVDGKLRLHARGNH